MRSLGGNVAKKKKQKPDDKEQSQRFVETARELEADESGKSFDKALKNVVPKKTRSKTH
jgi:hypothetical protein